MAWLELCFEANKPLSPQIEDILNELGALAVTIQDLGDEAIFEPEVGTTPIWTLNKITGLFDNQIDVEALIPVIDQQLGDTPLPKFSINALEDRAWEREWLIHFKPLIFGTKLVVCPSAVEMDKDFVPPDAVIMELDPGLAFGTGSHETTSLCLEWLGQQSLSGLRLFDYGCGSGILAIAARLLGCDSVWAYDIDPQALLASASNAEINHIEDGFNCLDSELLEELRPELECDILMANILAGPLEKLAKELGFLVKSGGTIVLSGILESQADHISACYQAQFTDIKITRKNDWVRLVGKRR